MPYVSMCYCPHSLPSRPLTTRATLTCARAAAEEARAIESMRKLGLVEDTHAAQRFFTSMTNVQVRVFVFLCVLAL